MVHHSNEKHFVAMTTVYQLITRQTSLSWSLAQPKHLEGTLNLWHSFECFAKYETNGYYFQHYLVAEETLCPSLKFSQTVFKNKRCLLRLKIFQTQFKHANVIKTKNNKSTFLNVRF